MSDGPTDDVVGEVWQRVRSGVAAKVALLAQAATALAAGTLTEELRADAWDRAHQLTGSLGSFGWADGAAAAAEAQRILRDPAPEDAPALAAAVDRMRSAVEA